MSKSYTHSLNLFKSSLPLHFDHCKVETDIIDRWRRNEVYEEVSRRYSDGRHAFELHDGPPYANGSIHPGHAVNKILKDSILKAKRLAGYDAPYRPGWDCHGLPIELKVEQEGEWEDKKGDPNFKKACQEYAESQASLQSSQMQRLGVVADWQQPYKTQDQEVIAKTLEVVAEMYGKGVIVRGELPVHWCKLCGSSLSDYEVVYRDKVSPSIYVKFYVLQSTYIEQLLPQDIESNRVFFLIWTTTIWTLQANHGIAVHPDGVYALVAIKEGPDSPKEYLVVLEELVDHVTALKGAKCQKLEVVATFKGESLVGTVVCHPFLAKRVPVLASDHITKDTGTGVVHIAPAHGEEDFAIGQRNGLGTYTSVGPDGLCHEENAIFDGIDIDNSTTVFRELLERSGALFYITDLSHSYPHCWRHLAPTFCRVAPQWFIDIDREMEGDGDTLRNRALKAIEDVTWIPQWGAKRIEAGIRNRPSWCISRQRDWGTPFPVLLHSKDGTPHPKNKEIILKVAEAIREGGREEWARLTSDDLVGEEGKDYIKENCVLDVWLDSGVTHISTRPGREKIRADMYLEGGDQFRGWFMSSLITSVALNNSAPYKSVLCHGFVLDGSGVKMSKSHGNTIRIEDVIEKYGAETLRGWVASTDCYSDISISEEILKCVSGWNKKIRNTLRFLVDNLQDFHESMALSWEEMVSFDQYALLQLRQLQDTVIEDYNKYRLQRVHKNVLHFCSTFLSNVYLESLKDRLYVEGSATSARRSAQTALFYILSAVTRLIFPFMTFTAESIWPHLMQLSSDTLTLSINMARFYKLPEGCYKEANIKSDVWELVFEMRNLVLQNLEKSRLEGLLKNNLSAVMTITISKHSRFMPLVALEDELHYLFNVSKVTILTLEDEEVVASTEVDIKIQTAAEQKCARCWMHKIEPSDAEDGSDICDRCSYYISARGGEDERWSRRHF